MNLFDPGPKTYNHLLDRLNRHIDLKYRDHSTALDFTLKATPSVSLEHEAEQARTRLLNDVDTGRYVEPTKLTLSELLEEWLEMTSDSVRISTWRFYRENVRLHLVPAIGGMRAQDLTATHLNSLYRRLLAQGRVILSGGAGSGGTLFNDTWAYDPTGDTWAALKPTDSPPRRCRASMVYESDEGRAILFGGAKGSACFNNTWAYGGRL